MQRSREETSVCIWGEWVVVVLTGSPGPGIIKALNAPTSLREKKRGEIAGGA